MKILPEILLMLAIALIGFGNYTAVIYFWTIGIVCLIFGAFIESGWTSFRWLCVIFILGSLFKGPPYHSISGRFVDLFKLVAAIISVVVIIGNFIYKKQRQGQ